MLMRNKQTRSLLFSSIIINIISIIVLNLKMGTKTPLVFKLMILLFASGYFFVFNYGRSLMSWEYYYLKDIFSREVHIKKFIGSKILLLQIYSLFIFLINLIFILLFQTNHFFLLFALFIFLTGIGVYIQAIISVYSVQPIRLNSGVISNERQKLLPIHMIGFSILYFFPISLFLLFNYNNLVQGVLIGCGTMGLLLTKKWLNFLANKVMNNKYKFLN